MGPKTIIITGKQGAGKATQVKYLLEKLEGEVFVFDTGNELRKFSKSQKGTFAGDKIYEILENGDLVPYWFPIHILIERLKKLKSNSHLILDGIARKPKQANLLTNVLNWFNRKDVKLLNIIISDEEAIKRIQSRCYCSKCNRQFVIPGNLDQKKCDKCGGDIIRRHDDDLETLKKRLSWSNNEVQQVINEYKNVWNYIKINGEQEKEKVRDDIFNSLNIS